MSQQTVWSVPTWTVGDRLRKAREDAELSQNQLADEIGISRRSVSTYEASASPPKLPVLLAWSFRTHVPMEWIRDGIDPGPDGPGSPFAVTRQYHYSFRQEKISTLAKFRLSTNSERPKHSLQPVPVATAA